MIISKKRYEKEIQRRINKALRNAEYQHRICRAENKIHRLTARIGKLEAQLAEEKKGSIKGYYVKEGETVCTSTENT